MSTEKYSGRLIESRAMETHNVCVNLPCFSSCYTCIPGAESYAAANALSDMCFHRQCSSATLL